MPLEPPVTTATLCVIDAVSLSDSGLARLADLRLCRYRRPDRDHGGRPTRQADPHGPADDARHDGHRRSRPGPLSGHPHPLRQRPGLRAFLRVGLRSHRPLGLAVRCWLRPRPWPPRPDADHSSAAGDPSPNGLGANRPPVRRPRATGPLRAELRAANRRRHPACSLGVRGYPGRLFEALAISIESAAATSVEWLNACGWLPSISPVEGSTSSARSPSSPPRRIASPIRVSASSMQPLRAGRASFPFPDRRTFRVRATRARDSRRAVERDVGEQLRGDVLAVRAALLPDAGIPRAPAS